MPQNKFALGRYCIIDMFLHKHTYVKTNAIVEYCNNKIGFTITQRTIQMDIQAMKEDPLLGFYAPIKYSLEKKAYFYENPDYVLFPFKPAYKDIAYLQRLIISSGDKIEQCALQEILLLIEKILVTCY